MEVQGRLLHSRGGLKKNTYTGAGVMSRWGAEEGKETRIRL